MAGFVPVPGSGPPARPKPPAKKTTPAQLGNTDAAGVFAPKDPFTKGTKVGGAINGSTQAPPMNIQGLQAMLQKQGYNIPVDGKMSPVLKAALRDFLQVSQSHPVTSRMLSLLKGGPITGLRNPKSFNQKFGLATGGKRTSIVDKPLVGKGGLLDNSGNMSPSYAAAASDPPVDLRGLGAIATQVGTPLPESLAAQLADSTAGAQYDPQIHNAQIALSRAPIQGAQDLADIKNWYGQVQGALGTAAGRDTAISQAGQGSVKDAVASIIASLGGGANGGSAVVGGAGADAVGTLAALGASQDMLNADLAPIFKSEAAGQLTSQARKNDTASQDLRNQLASLQGARGQLRSSTYDTNLLNLRDSNNKLAQQQFNNKLALQQAAEAAQLSGLKVLTASSKLGSKGSFGAASPTDLQSAANGIANHIVDANGKLLPGMTPSKAIGMAQTIARVYFPNGGVPGGWLQSIVSPFFSS